MESPEGQDALKMFLELWAEWMAKRAITAQEAQVQAAQETQKQEGENAGAEDNQSE